MARPPARKVAWDVSDADYEFYPLQLPPDVTRITATMRLTIEAEFGGWELARVRLYNDGSRRVLLRRRRHHHGSRSQELRHPDV